MAEERETAGEFLQEGLAILELHFAETFGNFAGQVLSARGGIVVRAVDLREAQSISKPGRCSDHISAWCWHEEFAFPFAIYGAPEARPRRATANPGRPCPKVPGARPEDQTSQGSAATYHSRRSCCFLARYTDCFRARLIWSPGDSSGAVKARRNPTSEKPKSESASPDLTG